MNELEKAKEWIHNQKDWTSIHTLGLVMYSGKMLSKNKKQWSCYIKQNKIDKRFYGETECECVELMVYYVKNEISKGLK